MSEDALEARCSEVSDLEPIPTSKSHLDEAMFEEALHDSQEDV